MFEIGSSLRQARDRRGLQLGDVERATRIRAKYLRALEEERFDAIPGDVYARGFLRTYADFLGLDADRFLEELASRTPPAEETVLPAPRPVQARRRVLSGSAGIAVLALAGAVTLVAIFILGMTGGGQQRAQPPPPPPPPPPPRTVAPAPQVERVPPRHALLVLRAVRGRCWVEARVGSAAGPLLYYSTLEQGRTLRLRRKRMWVRLGAPVAVSATLNGKAVPLPSDDNPTNLLVTPTRAVPA